MRTFTRLAAVTSLASLEALAANNWQQPCFSGHCTYELPTTHNTSSAAVHIWGSQNAISDVTTAGGWHILNCDPQTPAQDIRLVCTSHNASAAGCDHVMQGGAENTIVRLPENCTTAPFARVANVSVAEDQSVPAHTKRALFGRADATHPQVHTFTLDTNFSAIDTTRNGNVSFAVQGLNVPGYSGNFTIVPPAQTRRAASRAVGRGKARRVVFGRLPFLSRRADADTTTDTHPQPTETTSGADGTTSADTTATSDAGDVTTSSDASDPQQTGDPNDPDDPDTSTAPESSTLPPFQFNLHKNLFNESVACTAGGKNANAQSSAKVSVDLDAQATMQVVIGVDASGTLSPPKISDISLTASVLGSLDGKLSFTADASGKFNVPSKVLAQKAISGLSIPGILNVTPTFLISAQAQGSLGLGFVSSVDLNYNISSAEMTFPPQKKVAPKQAKPGRRAAAKGTGTSGSGAGGDTNSASVQRGDSAISLSTSSGSKGNADVSAHIIPEVGVALSGLGQSTNVVLKMDTSAELTLGPNSGGTSDPPSETDGSSSQTSSAASKTSNTASETSSEASETSSEASKTGSEASETAKSTSTARSTPAKPARRAAGSAQTCAKITTGMNMHASSDGNFFGLFDTTTSAQLFNKNFTLLNKCFPAGKAPANPSSTSSGTRSTSTGTHSTPIHTATDDPDDPNATSIDSTDAPEATSSDAPDDGTSTIDPDTTDVEPTATSSDPSAPTDDPDAGVTQTDSDSTPTDTASAQSSDSPVLRRTLRFSRGGSRRELWRAFMRQAQSNTGLQCSSTSGTIAPQPLVSQTVPADG